VLAASALAKQGIFLYHYSLLFPQQVIHKAHYYEAAGLAEGRDVAAWGEQVAHNLVDPFHVHNCVKWASWLAGFQGSHPPEVREMWADVLAGRTTVPARPMDDVKRIMSDPGFRLRRALLRAAATADGLQFEARKWFADLRRRRGFLSGGARATPPKERDARANLSA